MYPDMYSNSNSQFTEGVSSTSTPVKSKPMSTDAGIEPPRKKIKHTDVKKAAKKLMLKNDQKQVTEKVTCIDLDKYQPSVEVNVWITNKKFTLLNQDRDILLNPAGWLNTSIVSAAQILLKEEYGTAGKVLHE